MRDRRKERRKYEKQGKDRDRRRKEGDREKGKQIIVL
jgi:hypothetical protein